MFIFTGEAGEKHGYRDGFQEDGVFHYTREGQIGDQQLTRGNLALTQPEREIHLFEQMPEGGLVRYLGRAAYLNHFIRSGRDREGNERKVLIFEFDVFAESTPPTEAPNLLRPVRKSPKKSLAELRKLASESAQTSPATERRVLVMQRSQAVKDYVRLRANGHCEGCGGVAPFKNLAGEPYLEPHHIRRLADGGPDDVAWVIALCPTCHRRVHYAEDGAAYNRHLADRMRQLEPTARNSP